MRPYVLLTAAVLALAACTQDELSSSTEGIEGAYPLQIGSVSLTAEVSEEPWTRVSESTDGQSSVWNDGDEFHVKFEGSDEVGTYRITDAATGAVEAVTPIYWKSTQPTKIIAWYANPQPNPANYMFLYYQDDGLAYLLRAEQTVAYGNTPVSLQFTHQFAKVRVVTKGTADVTDIKLVNVPTDCYIEEGRITKQEGIASTRIGMLQVEREGIGTCWEANVGPDVELKHFEITIFVGDEIRTPVCELSSPVTTQAGALHTITWTVNNEGTTTIDLSTEDYTINDDGTYYFSGTASHAIRVTGGNPEIYLEDAQISVASGNAIDITNGASPTIHVMGENTIANNSIDTDGAGIYVAEGSTVTITGRDRNDVLTAQAGGDAAGIGGCSNNQDCGSINISNVTVIARGSNLSYCSPGIGSTQTYQCGDITIDNATVHAYGTEMTICGCPGIGAGLDISGSTGTTPPNVTIRNNSEVHTHRGNSYADYIGLSYFMTSGDGLVRATVDASSVVYKYTGDGNTPDE